MVKQVYQVEKIIGHRIRGGHVEYHIKWSGYSLKQATYEPAKNILDKALLKKYQDKNLSPSEKKSATSVKKQRPIKKSPKTVTPKKQIKSSTPKPLKTEVKSKQAHQVKAIHNHQKDVNKVLQSHHVSSIKNVFKSSGQTHYSVTLGKSSNEYLITSQQLAKSAKPELIVKFYENLIH